MKTRKWNLVESLNEELSKREMEALKGGYQCGCGCGSLSEDLDNTEESASCNHGRG